MQVQGTHTLNRSGEEPSSRGSRDRSAFRAPSAKRVTRDGQPPTLKQASLNRIGHARQSFSPAQMEQVKNSLPAHLRGQVSETMRVANLTDLPDYRAALAAIPPAEMTRPPNTAYVLPAPYNEYRNLPAGWMNYSIGEGYMLSGGWGLARNITGPNRFFLILGHNGDIYLGNAGNMRLNENTPYPHKVEMMHALQLAANSARRGLGPVLGTPRYVGF
jgi:hypothetical protein